MTRIMTNIPSMTGQKYLQRNMSTLQQSLTRLSTGLKINSGADDPAGLISSEILRSEITGIKTALKNTERANGMIATADSALNEVSKLLNDIRGLVTEAANTGGMSYDMIAANQLQVNASLDAIDRIAASTSFMGGNLLDGTLDFQTRNIDRYGMQSMNIRQVAFPDNGQPVNVSVDVIKAAEQAQLFYAGAATADKVNLSWGGNYGYQMQTFEKSTSVQTIADVINKTSNSTGVVAEVGSDAIAGKIYISNVGAGNDIIIESGTKGLNAGCVDVKFLTGSAEGILVDYQESIGAGYAAKLNVYLQTEAWKSSSATGLVTANPAGVLQNSALDFTAVIAGSQYNGSDINIVDGLLTHAGFRTDAGNVSGVGDMPFAMYADTATQAKALMGDVNGLKAYKNGLGTDIVGGYTTLTAKNGGADLNNVNIKYQGTADPNILKGRPAVAVYDKDTKNYTIYVDSAAVPGTIVFSDIVEAVRSEGTFTMTLSGINAATTFGAANLAAGAVLGNTSNSGGDAGTLFIYATTSNPTTQYRQISPTPATLPDVTGAATTVPLLAPWGMSLTVNDYRNLYSVIPNIPAPPHSFNLNIVGGGALGSGAVVQGYDQITGVMTVQIEDTVATYDNVKAAVNTYEWLYDPASTPPPYNPYDIPAGTFVLNLGTHTAITSALPVAAAEVGNPVPWAAITNAALNTAGWTAARVVEPNTATQVRNVFDLSNVASRGSEAAAALFNVERSIDNDGTGRVYAQAFTGTKAMSGGVTGGSVISTGNDVVTALNNSLYWNSIMCDDLMDRLYASNAAGTFYDRTNPPPIVSRLATGQHGLTAVSAFSEVAYYGSPYDGTALQFLGGTNSPAIRFVTGAAGSGLSIDTSSLAATIDYAQAVLSGVNPNSSMVITAKAKGGGYDDMQFVYRQAQTIVAAVPVVPATVPPTFTVAQTPANGWAEYDPGETFAAAQCNFAGITPPQTNPSFLITANERGDMHNNVGIRMNTVALQDEKVVVKLNTVTNTLDISLGMLAVTAPPSPITLQDVIDAVNAADLGFTATPSFAIDPRMNTNTVLVDVAHTITPGLPLSSIFTSLGNTGESGGHKGQVTVWMAEGEDVIDAVAHINQHTVVGQMFSAQTYTPVQHSPATPTAGKIDYVRNERITTQGGQTDPGTIVVNLATDKSGNSSTTAKQFVEWWQSLPEDIRSGISVSLLRQPGDNWDDVCEDDTAGLGFLKPTITPGECDTTINNDIRFVGWYDDCDEPYAYKAAYASGVMTSQIGEEASYTLTARKPGPAYNGYSIRYVDDPSLTGKFDDNVPTGTVDECGNTVYPAYMLQDGLYLEINEKTKEITIHIRSGFTQAIDIKQLIENDPKTKHLFNVALTDGEGKGTVQLSDNTLTTANGSYPPGYYDGAKLLFGADAANYNLVFRSLNYGSDQFVDVQGLILNGNGSVFNLKNAKGEVAERSYGTDVFARINGVKATGHGLNVSLNTQALSLTFTLGSHVDAGYSSTFQIVGGGATFQIGPRVVTSQQISIAFRNLNTVQLGGQSGRLYELREGNECDLFSDTFRGYRIIEEAIIDITTMRGALGSLQKTTLDTNVNVLNDTLEAIMTAESVVRDTDFAEETANLTRSQILAQANIQALSIANQLPNYILRLLGG